MTEQKPQDAEHPAEDAGAAPTYPPVMSRRQHLGAALQGRPVVIAAAVVTALAVGFGGFGIGYAVGHDDRGDQFSRVVFERGELPGGPGGDFGRGLGGPGWGDRLPPNEGQDDSSTS
ncbi:MAG TPA: hypothetical protein VFK41_06610 [Nocardioidaceae bacterium]|nr:hypothetical protein [Nocardioidaceae bacterium]